MPLPKLHIPQSKKNTVHRYKLYERLDEGLHRKLILVSAGAGACDLAILRHLYKFHIKQLATGIGVPREITQKKSSGDLFGNEAWENAMGMTYDHRDPGFSDKVDYERHPFDVMDLAKDAISILNSMDIAIAHVIGHSMAKRITWSINTGAFKPPGVFRTPIWRLFQKWGICFLIQKKYAVEGHIIQYLSSTGMIYF